MKYNWTGLLVEPSPHWWKELKSKNRNAWILPHCLSTEKRVHLIDFYIFSPTFKGMGDDFGFNSRKEMNESFYQDIVKNNPGAINKLKVQCFPIQAVLKAINSPTVTYFSLDIEGEEYNILKTMDFSEIDISVLGVEIFPSGPDDALRINSGTKEQIHDYLKENSYNFVDSVEIDDFFIKQSFAANVLDV